MSIIAIAGQSGTGKSSSYGNIPEIGIKGLDPKETVVINVAGKDLPFRGWKKVYTGSPKDGGNYVEVSDAQTIAKIIEFISASRPDIKNIVLDDSQYIMAFEFMRRAKEAGYGKFSDIGVNISKVIEAGRVCRKDLVVYCIWHPEKDGMGDYKLKTVGKMVDDYLTLEGLFTVILYTKVNKGLNNNMEYMFVTNNDGEYPAKSPVGMFKDMYMPNDLSAVSTAIVEYNNG